jgi:hypothetical protein
MAMELMKRSGFEGSIILHRFNGGIFRSSGQDPDRLKFRFWQNPKIFPRLSRVTP